MRLRNRLLVLVLSVLIPAFIAAAVAVGYVYQEEQKNQEKALIEAARAFALLVDNELQTKEAVLRTLVRSPMLIQADWPAFYEYAKELAPTAETAIIVMMPNGEQLLNTRRPFGAPLPARTASNLPELAKRYGPSRNLVSDVYLSSVGKRYDFAIQVPVVVGDGSPYSLVMGVNAAEMNKLMAAQRFPQQWIATIVDRQGQVVTRSRDPGQFIGKAIRDRSVQIVSGQPEGTYDSMTLDDIPVKVVFSHVPIADWKVLISIPVDELRRTSVRATAFLTIILVMLLIFAIVAARWLARWVIRPIDGLGQAAERLGRGEDARYQAQGLREADAVGEVIVQASDKIQRAQLDLHQRVDEAVAAAKRAEQALLQSQKLEALGRLTGGIAHEFNNLLQTLVTTLQLAELTTKEARTRSLVQTSQKALDRAAALTRQLSAFGRVQDARLETVDLRERISGFLPLIKGALPGAIDFQVVLEAGVFPVTLDPLQLELALLNIALNARDAMQGQGTLLLRLENRILDGPDHGLPAGDYACIRMADDGSGMTAEELSRALDPFFTTKAVGKGSGMGLTQAYAFAVQANGTLVLDSAEHKGTTVTIYLPRATQAINSGGTAMPGDERKALPEGSGVILYVEDDELVRASVVPALQSAGFTVLVAATGDEAWAMLEGGHAVDVLFSDIVMPGKINGKELATRVRDRFPATRVILATGYSEERVAIPGVRLLAKPYDIGRAIELLLMDTA